MSFYRLKCFFVFFPLAIVICSLGLKTRFSLARNIRCTTCYFLPSKPIAWIRIIRQKPKRLRFHPVYIITITTYYISIDTRSVYNTPEIATNRNTVKLPLDVRKSISNSRSPLSVVVAGVNRCQKQFD